MLINSNSVSKMKIDVNYLKIFDNPFSKYINCERISECIGFILGYLPKSNRCLELVSAANFEHIFHENFPYITFYWY